MDIKRYDMEISYIICELKNLERGIFYEEGCTRHPGTASAKTVAKNVRESFIELMEKIAEEKPGNAEIINKTMNNLQK